MLSWHHILILHQEANFENQLYNENLQSKRNLRIDLNLKSYLENPINFNPSWFLRPVSMFRVPTLFRAFLNFPMTLIFRVSLDPA
jgi:hypothetical protein